MDVHRLVRSAVEEERRNVDPSRVERLRAVAAEPGARAIARRFVGIRGRAVELEGVVATPDVEEHALLWVEWAESVEKAVEAAEKAQSLISRLRDASAAHVLAPVAAYGMEVSGELREVLESGGAAAEEWTTDDAGNSRGALVWVYAREVQLVGIGRYLRQVRLGGEGASRMSWLTALSVLRSLADSLAHLRARGLVRLGAGWSGVHVEEGRKNAAVHVRVDSGSDWRCVERRTERERRGRADGELVWFFVPSLEVAKKTGRREGAEVDVKYDWTLHASGTRGGGGGGVGEAGEVEWAPEVWDVHAGQASSVWLRRQTSFELGVMMHRVLCGRWQGAGARPAVLSVGACALDVGVDALTDFQVVGALARDLVSVSPSERPSIEEARRLLWWAWGREVGRQGGVAAAKVSRRELSGQAGAGGGPQASPRSRGASQAFAAPGAAGGGGAMRRSMADVPLAELCSLLDPSLPPSSWPEALRAARELWRRGRAATHAATARVELGPDALHGAAELWEGAEGGAGACEEALAVWCAVVGRNAANRARLRSGEAQDDCRWALQGLADVATVDDRASVVEAAVAALCNLSAALDAWSPAWDRVRDAAARALAAEDTASSPQSRADATALVRNLARRDAAAVARWPGVVEDVARAWALARDADDARKALEALLALSADRGALAGFVAPAAVLDSVARGAEAAGPSFHGAALRLVQTVADSAPGGRAAVAGNRAVLQWLAALLASAARASERDAALELVRRLALVPTAAGPMAACAPLLSAVRALLHAPVLQHAACQVLESLASHPASHPALCRAPGLLGDLAALLDVPRCDALAARALNALSRHEAFVASAQGAQRGLLRAMARPLEHPRACELHLVLLSALLHVAQTPAAHELLLESLPPALLAAPAALPLVLELCATPATHVALVAAGAVDRVLGPACTLRAGAAGSGDAAAPAAHLPYAQPWQAAPSSSSAASALEALRQLCGGAAAAAARDQVLALVPAVVAAHRPPPPWPAALVRLLAALLGAPADLDRVMAACGAELLHGLVATLHVGAEGMAQSSALAELLHTIASAAAHRSAVAQSGAVPALVALLTEGSDEAKGAAASALRALAMSVANRALIADAGALPALVQLLRGSAPGSAPRARAIGALSMLASNPANRAAIGDAPGACEALVAILAAGEPERDEAAACVWSLAWGNAANQARLLAGGAVAPLVAALRDPRTSMHGRGCAAGALRNLAMAAAAQMRVAQEGAIPPLVALLRDGDTPARANAAGALQNIAMLPWNKAAVLDAGALPLLVALLRAAGADRAARATAAGALQNLALDEAGDEASHAVERALVDEHAVVPDLVLLLRDGDDDGRANAAGALRNLALHREHARRVIVAAGAVPPLVALLRDVSDAARSKAAATLRNLALQTEFQAAIADAHALPPLVALLASPDTPCKVAAAGALQNLALLDANQDAIVAAAALPPLVALLTHADVEVQANAAGTLQNLARAEPNRPLIARAGAIPPLVALARDGASEDAKAKATGALQNLSERNEPNRKAILAATRKGDAAGSCRVQ
jgi:vacuolar protein 8